MLADRRVVNSDDLTAALRAVQMVDEMAATKADHWAVKLVDHMVVRKVVQMVEY